VSVCGGVGAAGRVKDWSACGLGICKYGTRKKSEVLNAATDLSLSQTSSRAVAKLEGSKKKLKSVSDDRACGIDMQDKEPFASERPLSETSVCRDRYNQRSPRQTNNVPERE
jgi:hypothetical protein